MNNEKNRSQFTLIRCLSVALILSVLVFFLVKLEITLSFLANMMVGTVFMALLNPFILIIPALILYFIIRKLDFFIAKRKGNSSETEIKPHFGKLKTAFFAICSTFLIIGALFSVNTNFNPKGRKLSNEISAIGTLRSTYTAQNQFQNSLKKDRDADGVGEFGYFTELSGITPCPVGTSPGHPARPGFVAKMLGEKSAKNSGLVLKRGYYYKLFLPGKLKPIPESGKAVLPKIKATEEINAQEERWCLYAWPEKAGPTGIKAYFINQSGKLMISSNTPQGSTNYFYSGTTTTPSATDIFDTDGTGNLDSSIITGKEAAHKIIWNPKK